VPGKLTSAVSSLKWEGVTTALAYASTR
jgi:hypothetical protein